MRLFHGAGALALAAALMFGVTTAAQAQAFGIREGTPVSALQGVEDMGGGHYTVTPPEPNPRFALYWVKATPETGVCMVAASSPDMYDDARGIKVRDSLQSLVAALSTRYGPPTVSRDRLADDAVQLGVNDWTRTLHDGDRTVLSAWRIETPELRRISAHANASTRDTTTVSVIYEFQSITRCDQITTADSAAGL